MLSDPQIERYSRQIILPQVGGKGQERLLQASVLVSGDSSLQAEALLYLAAAGVGRLGIYGIRVSIDNGCACPGASGFCCHRVAAA